MGKEKQHFRVGSAVGIICINYLLENFLEYKNRYITGFLLIFVACALLTDSLYGLSKALIILISSIFYAIKHMIKTINCKIWTYIFILTFSS